MTNKTTITVEPGSHAILIEREFDHPAELLLRACSEPDLLVRWLGPRYLTTTMDEYVPGHGGRYKFTQTAPDGGTHVFRGVLHGEPSIENGVVQTFEYLGFPGHVSMDTMRFEQLDGGRSAVRVVSLFQSVEARDGMAQSGMSEGVTEGYERLDEVLDELAAG